MKYVIVLVIINLVLSGCKDLDKTERPCPIIYEISPNSASVGEIVNVTGDHFFFSDPSLYQVFINDQLVPSSSIEILNSTSMNIEVPNNIGSGLIRIEQKEYDCATSIQENVAFKYHCSEILNDDLVLHISFDQNLGDPEKITDLSSFQHPINRFGGSFISNRCEVGKNAFFFDGLNDSLVVLPHSSFNFQSDNSFTISLWVKFGEQCDLEGTESWLITKWERSSPSYPFNIRLLNRTTSTPGIMYGTLGDDCDSNRPNTFSQDALNDETWHHLVLVRNGVLQELELYVDCELEDIDNRVVECNTQNDSPIYIGMDNNFGLKYKGAMDDLRIYRRALNEDEVKCLFYE